MKGVVLAGGTGSRLYPLTKVTNKHLLPVGLAPMIWHPIWKLKQAGMDEILIVTGTDHMGDVVGLLGSGKDFGCRFTYKVQDEAGGIAQALGLAENFAGNDSVCVILGDNIFQDSLAGDADAFRAQGRGARILLKPVQDPQRFGVAEVQGDNVVSIEEKPKAPKSNLAVTGIYFYDAAVFDIIRTVKPSGRGEMEITDVNNAYIAKSDLSFGTFQGWWSDAGTFPSLAHANELALQGEAPFPHIPRKI
ncbi:MAG: NTP transferase domain-containing protein [Acidobacteria bacterium]|nr:NTP transferase domain-containing protein [Acidobacteriota bacterium]